MEENLNLLLGRGPPKGARKLKPETKLEKAPDVSYDAPPEE